MATRDKDTVAIHFVIEAVARLGSAERADVLAAAGLPEDLLASPGARVPSETFAVLWLAIARRCDDEFFGLDRRRMKVGSFALLCHAALHGRDLEQALRQILRGLSTFLDDIGGELRRDGRDAVVTIANRIRDDAARRFADETFLVLVHGLACWLVGKRIALTSVDFAHRRPLHAAEYAVMYSQTLAFDAAATAVRFDAALLGAPVVQSARSLKAFLRTAPQSVFLKYKNEAGWAARTRRRLRDAERPGDWPSLETVAQALRVTPTTLRRRLAAEGTSYRDIKDQLRRDSAIHQLCTTARSIADIGCSLGFQETSAFHRAFKKWSGVQPGQYRLQRAVAAAERPDG